MARISVPASEAVVILDALAHVPEGMSPAVDAHRAKLRGVIAGRPAPPPRLPGQTDLVETLAGCSASPSA